MHDSGELMRAKHTVTLWLYCAPSPRKDFCLSVSLTLENRVFRCSLFSKFFVLQNSAFCSFRSAFYKSSKVFELWRLRPQSRTADTRCYGSRQNSQRYTLRFSGVQIFFLSFGSWRVRSSATVHCEVRSKRYSLPISL